MYVCLHCQNESYVSKVYGQTMCYWSFCIYVFVQSEDQNYAQNVYHQAMYNWLLSAHACSE